MLPGGRPGVVFASGRRKHRGGEQAEGAWSEKAPPYPPVGVRTDAKAVMPERAAVARGAAAYLGSASGTEKAKPANGAPCRPEHLLAALPEGGQTPGVQAAVSVGAFPDGAGRSSLTVKAEAAYAGYGRCGCHGSMFVTPYGSQGPCGMPLLPSLNGEASGRKGRGVAGVAWFRQAWTPQHFLNFLPLPQGQGSLRPTLGDGRQ